MHRKRWNTIPFSDRNFSFTEMRRPHESHVASGLRFGRASYTRSSAINHKMTQLHEMILINDNGNSKVSNRNYTAFMSLHPTHRLISLLRSRAWHANALRASGAINLNCKLECRRWNACDGRKQLFAFYPYVLIVKRSRINFLWNAHWIRLHVRR